MNNRYFHTIDELIDGLIDEVIKYVPDGIQYQELNVEIGEIEYITLGGMRMIAHALLSISGYRETPGGMEHGGTQLI